MAEIINLWVAKKGDLFGGQFENSPGYLAVFSSKHELDSAHKNGLIGKNHAFYVEECKGVVVDGKTYLLSDESLVDVDLSGAKQAAVEYMTNLERMKESIK